jgi:uncharacterized damage-inducible protein DinB
MTQIASLIKEFERETRTTRKHLERLPNDKLHWRPHEKSYTAGALASHIVECIDWTDSIFKLDYVDIDAASYKPYQAKSSDDLLSTFDATVTKCKQVLTNVADEDLEQPWGLKINGRLRFEKPRAEVFRDFTLSHLIHHRGQFSVYLRLLGVPVPGSYGPSADELP